jgi:signal transduction histidine kinase
MNIRSLSLRAKLVLIFVCIKVVPLILLAWVAWSAADHLGRTLGQRAAVMADSMVGTIREVGNKVTTDAISALDDRSREAIERLTTDTARAVAGFLYERDADILLAAQLDADEAIFRRFVENRSRPVYLHAAWHLTKDGSRWEPVRVPKPAVADAADPGQALADNAKAFHARPPEYFGERQLKPLYAEMTYVDLRGVEQVKVVSSEFLSGTPRDIRDPANTFVRAEHYWQALQRLKPGEIYVSEVIGAYVGSHVVGPYTPEAADKAGVKFDPANSAYAGTENPVGKRFRGIIRWATPVVRNGQIKGYVTLALDHEHLRQFTDRISPTEQRYTPIIDAISGNYAFMWDHKSRAIAHPRDYMIPGFDPATGEEVVPWLDQTLYRAWQDSGLPWKVFAAGLKPFDGQSLTRRPAAEMIKAGTLGLDCRYLNFSPQCSGWNQLTERGGSGSFEIFFSGLRKLTTAAAIPYYTGQYARSKRGFGFVTIGANVEEFHQAATESARQIAQTIEEKDRLFRKERQGLLETARESMREMTARLSWATFLMAFVVIAIAVWMANFLVAHIHVLVRGIQRFQSGDLKQRFRVHSSDEMGQLAEALNDMTTSVEESFQRSEEARAKAEEANRIKTEFLATVSHELRTPLNGILGFADLLALDVTDPVMREHVATIKSSGRHLLGVVNDLLDMARVEAGKMAVHPEPFELRPFLADLIHAHQKHARDKGLSLECEIGEGVAEMLFTDALRLRQALTNLVNNAVKYTDQGGVSVCVSGDEEMVQFEVIDTGCGIAPEDQQLAFEKFGGVGGKAQRDKGGTGLGLSLVRCLASLLGGTIALSSTLGEGSRFTLAIPVKHAACPDLPLTE